MILSLYSMTPSLLDRCLRYWWYFLSAGGRLCCASGIPSSMMDSRRTMFSSEEVAVWTCSHVTELVECREQASASCRVSSVWVEDSWSSMEMPAISCEGMEICGYVMTSVMAWMSSVSWVCHVGLWGIWIPCLGPCSSPLGCGPS